MSYGAWEVGKCCDSEKKLCQRVPTHWHTILWDFCSIPSKAEVTLSNRLYLDTTWYSQWTCSKSRTLVTKQRLIKTKKILKIMSENYSGIRWHLVIYINSIDSVISLLHDVGLGRPRRSRLNAAPDDSRYSRSVCNCFVLSLAYEQCAIQCSKYRWVWYNESFM